MFTVNCESFRGITPRQLTAAKNNLSTRKIVTAVRYSMGRAEDSQAGLLIDNASCDLELLSVVYTQLCALGSVLMHVHE